MDQTKPVSQNLNNLEEELDKMRERIADIASELTRHYAHQVKTMKARDRLNAACTDISVASQLIFQAKQEVK